MNPAQDVANFLDADGPLGLTLGTDLFIGLARDHKGIIPDNAVFVHGRSGRSPDRVMGDVTEVRHPIVHTIVRHRDYQVGDTLARDIMDLLRGASIAGYLDIGAVTSEPEPGVQDEQKRFNWLNSFLLAYNESG